MQWLACSCLSLRRETNVDLQLNNSLCVVRSRIRAFLVVIVVLGVVVVVDIVVVCGVLKSDYA